MKIWDMIYFCFKYNLLFRQIEITFFLIFFLLLFYIVFLAPPPPIFFLLFHIFNSPKEGECDCAFMVLIISVYSVAGFVSSKGKSAKERNVMQLHKSCPDVTAGLS